MNLTILDLGTTFQQVVLLRQGHGSPSGPVAFTTEEFLHVHLPNMESGVESPEQIGRVERHGGLFKAVLKRMISEHAVQVLTTKIAIAEAVSAELRASARRAYIREDCGRRVARAVLRKVAPLVGEYATGDIVCYRKEDQGWSPACRLIGFDGNKTARLICAGTPVCAAVDRLRPATSAEALAMQFAQNVEYEPGHPEDQQAFVDARASLNRDEDELVDDSLEDRPVQETNDLETPHSLMEPEFERGNTPPRPDPQ